MANMASGKPLSSLLLQPIYSVGNINKTSSREKEMRSVLSTSLGFPQSPESSRHPAQISKFTTSKMQAAFQNEMEAANLGTSIVPQPFDLLPNDVQAHFHEQVREAKERNDQERIAALIDMLPSKKLAIALPQNGTSKRSRVSFGASGPINQRVRPNGTTPLIFRKTIAGRIKYFYIYI